MEGAALDLLRRRFPRSRPITPNAVLQFVFPGNRRSRRRGGSDPCRACSGLLLGRGDRLEYSPRGAAAANAANGDGRVRATENREPLAVGGPVHALLDRSRSLAEGAQFAHAE